MSAAESLSARAVQGGGMDTFKSINTYPMQNSPMMNMPNPAAFSVHGLRTHSYSSLIGATMMINAFDMCGGEPTLSIACKVPVNNCGAASAARDGLVSVCRCEQEGARRSTRTGT